jgi:hypothetical protein
MTLMRFISVGITSQVLGRNGMIGVLGEEWLMILKK